MVNSMTQIYRTGIFRSRVAGTNAKDASRARARCWRWGGFLVPRNRFSRPRTDRLLAGTPLTGNIRYALPSRHTGSTIIGRKSRTTKGHVMWALVIFTFATSSAATGTVTTLEFNTQQLCLMAARELQALVAPVISEGPARYRVAGTCVQTSEVTKK